tara:strand:- start:62 stop:373 length:312 start_codon:yes stop_codon:yes gene_type:complete
MAANEIHVDDIGTKFIVTVKDDTSVINVSGATTKEIVFKKPSGTKVTAAASFESDGTDGVLSYTTTGTELDETGTYKIQAHVVLSAGNDFHSDISTFKVYRNI